MTHRFFRALTASAIALSMVLLSASAEAGGRKGSHRVGGTNSHGKGSHYVGGHSTAQKKHTSNRKK